MKHIEYIADYFGAFLGRILFSFWGGIVAVMTPRIPIILICFLAVFMDCYTAWALSRRVKKKYPGKADGKFKSENFGKVIMTLIKIGALIFLVGHMEVYIFTDVSVPLTKIAAGAVCFWQIWSMLENESSCNDAKWARIAQKIMVDKTERHFDIDLSLLKHKDDENDNDDATGNDKAANDEKPKDNENGKS